MNPDIRLWFHLLYLTDQIKAADQKAYFAMALVCGFLGLSRQGFSWFLYYLTSGKISFFFIVPISILVILCIVGLFGTLSEFFRIIFPKTKSHKYIKYHLPSAIFWHDVAQKSFEDFRKQYTEEDREEDLVVQLYVLSKIAEEKYSRIRRLFTLAVLTISFDITLLSVSKVA
jgi:hypothetical protein